MRRHSAEADGAPVRVLYSFPHKIGAGRICHTAWQQVAGAAAAGVDLTVFPGAVHRRLPEGIEVRPTLARGRFRVPYRVIGQHRALAVHDAIVAQRLERLPRAFDVVHTWPLGALQTLRTARKLGIPTMLERPNAHTRFAYEVVRAESDRLGVELPPDHEHAYNEAVLAKEEEEYRLAERLLCPSEFVAQTFVDEGFSRDRLARHQYGYDPAVFSPALEPRDDGIGLRMLFVGVCAVRKGVHFALEAWLRSSAHERGEFLIAGEFLPAYEEKLRPMLTHPSVVALGHRTDIPELMRRSDVFVLPSLEEGFPLASAEARGSGCVPLVSDACSAACTHNVNGLVHAVGDVDTLARQITLLDQDRELLQRLRAASLETAPELSWAAAGRRLAEAYREVVREAGTRSVAAASA